MNTSTKPARGTLYLVPAPLDFGCDSQSPLTDVLPEATLRRAAGLTHWICENAKSTRAYLNRIAPLFPLAATIQEQSIVELPREAHKKGDHGDKGSAVFDAKQLLAPALAGHDIGLV
ncbi:MAG: ribosomal RNA small subunit methyltransferase I, partial [Comamonas sp.]